MITGQEARLERMLTCIDALPPLPQVAHALMRCGDGVDFDLHALCERVQADQAITLRVLRVANSPFYGMQGSCQTVQDAVVVLGSATLRAIALTAALLAPFALKRSQCFEPQRFWRHALGSAVLAQHMATLVSVPRDLAFTAGLLHQIGLLAFVTIDGPGFDQVHELARRDKVGLERAERLANGWTHFELGAALADRWALPEPLCEVIRHGGGAPGGRALPAHAGLIDIVHLGSRLSHLLSGELDRQPPEQLPALLAAGLAAHPVSDATRVRLGVPAAYLLALLPRAARDLRRLEAMLG